MRDIKFRVWYEYFMAPVVEIHQSTEEYGGGVCIGISGIANLFKPDKDHVLMQYTGLKDKNGVEVYEGDILENTLDNNRYNFTVEWGVSGFGLKKICSSTEIESMCPARKIWINSVGPMFSSPSLIKIIGNIHEDMQLLHVPQSKDLSDG